MNNQLILSSLVVIIAIVLIVYTLLKKVSSRNSKKSDKKKNVESFNEVAIVDIIPDKKEVVIEGIYEDGVVIKNVEVTLPLDIVLSKDYDISDIVKNLGAKVEETKVDKESNEMLKALEAKIRPQSQQPQAQDTKQSPPVVKTSDSSDKEGEHPNEDDEVVDPQTIFEEMGLSTDEMSTIMYAEDEGESESESEEINFFEE